MNISYVMNFDCSYVEKVKCLKNRDFFPES